MVFAEEEGWGRGKSLYCGGVIFNLITNNKCLTLLEALGGAD